MSVDIPILRRWVGHSETAAGTVSPRLVQQFNATFDLGSGNEPGDEAPLLIHYCLAQPAVQMAELGEDGHPARGGFLPPVQLPRRMWAGSVLTFRRPLCVGDMVERRSVIEDVWVKNGRTGDLCFVKVLHRYYCNGEEALTEEQDIVYRGAGSGQPAGAAAEAAPNGRYLRRISPTAPLLFRYSAITFNAHRIHYDLPYATRNEGYPGLVVHGPLQATLLCQIAADLEGARPTSFRVRSLAPLFDNADFTVYADESGERLKLWTARADGRMAMEAEAEW